jgi:1-deoxy-D-xylulose-5-phosphate reductoisomerase
MDYPQLTFEKPDREVFKNLDLAYKAMEMEGTAACILNAANEVTVDAFLNDRIGFLEIGEINEQTLKGVASVPKPSYDDYVHADLAARAFASELIQLQGRI